MTSSSTKGAASSVLDVVLHVKDLVLEVPIKDGVVDVENETSSSVLGIEDLQDQDEDLVHDNFEDVVLNIKNLVLDVEHLVLDLVLEDLVLGSIEDVGLDVEDRGRG